MTDRISKQTRTRVMRSVRSSGTKLEAALRDVFAAAEVTGLTEHPPGVPGRPDWASLDARLAIFVDSCFWHGCRWHLRLPASRRSYWEAKIRRNRKRDRKVNQQLRDRGWIVIRIWEHQLASKAKLARKMGAIHHALQARAGE